MGDVSKPGEQRVIGNYKLVAKLGSGGMGSVFRAQHTKTGQIVAFKVLMPSDAKNERLVQRFRRESVIAQSVRHPHVVEGIEAGMVGNLMFLAMEYVEGESLAELLRRDKRMKESDAVVMLKKIASGLSYAHTKQLIHRDIKPENVLLGRDGSVKICDLGLAREVADTGFTMMGAALGTPKYMSPEQVAGLKTIDARSDIYSLGATAYHMLAGQSPYQAKSAAMMMSAQVTGKFTPIREVAPDVSERIAKVIEKCMRKDPSERYQTVDEVIAALGGGGVGPKRPRKSRGKVEKSSSGSGLIIIGILLVLGVMAAGVWAAVWGPLKTQSREIMREMMPVEQKSK